jgi:hypothetical protein
MFMGDSISALRGTRLVSVEMIINGPMPQWIPLAVSAMAALLGALLGAWSAHIFSAKRDRLREKEEEIRAKEEAYNKLFPLEVTTQRIYSIHCRINRRFAITSHAPGVDIEWLAMSAQTKFNADIELTRTIKDLGDTCGLIRLRFENTPELIGLTNAFIHHHIKYRDELMNQLPPKDMSAEEIEIWVGTALDKWFYSLWGETFGPTFIALIEYIMANITKEKNELDKMKKNSWKFWGS